jgi:hypothetical protein
MAGKSPRGAPYYDFFHLLNNDSTHHDIYVISAQECMTSIGKSFIETSKESFNKALLSRLGPNFCFIHSVSLQATNLAIVTSRKLAVHISNIESSVEKTGKGNLANKGGVRVSFKLASSHLCFIACHLTSGEAHLERRN